MEEFESLVCGFKKSYKISRESLSFSRSVFFHVKTIFAYISREIIFHVNILYAKHVLREIFLREKYFRVKFHVKEKTFHASQIS